MVGTETRTERALALRRLADRSRNEVSIRASGAVSGLQAGLLSHLGLAVELLLASVVSTLVALLIVQFSLTAVPSDGPPPVLIPAPALNREQGEDLDPRDPLVFCTQFVTHTHCVREAT